MNLASRLVSVRRTSSRSVLDYSLLDLTPFVLVMWAGFAAAQDYTIINRFPHDTSAYTQGLVHSQGRLYESTGRLGHSQVRRVDPRTGRVLAATTLPADRFGEGLTLLDEKLYQLTWRSGIGYVYDAANLALVGTFAITGEGWGLTTDGDFLIMSDGSATLRFIEPRSFSLVREVLVRHDGQPVEQLNELEYVHGYLYANVYPSDMIVRLDPANGQVVQLFDLSGLLPDEQRWSSDHVLNGIAFNKENDTFLVTGKLWPALFEVALRGSGVPKAPTLENNAE